VLILITFAVMLVRRSGPTAPGTTVAADGGHPEEES
jgi:hypothetical protein